MKNKSKNKIKNKSKKKSKFYGIIIGAIISFIVSIGINFMTPIINRDATSVSKSIKFVGLDTSEYGAFVGIDEDNSYDANKKSSLNEAYKNAAENRIWVENIGETTAKVTGGVLRVENITEIDESETALQMIAGIKDNYKLQIYIVNNSYTDLNNVEFDFISHEFVSFFPVLSREEMEQFFNTKNFKFDVKQILSGEILKLFEFSLSDNAEKLLSQSEYPYLFRLATKVGGKELNITTYQLYNNEGHFGFIPFSQGGEGIEKEGSNSIPNIFIDTQKDIHSEFPINIDNTIESKNTTCLVQYLIPNKSAKIKYSIELNINNKKIDDEMLKNIEVNIKVPIYSIETGYLSKNEEAFKCLVDVGFEKISPVSHNIFITNFLYNPKNWVRNNQNF